MSDSLTKEEQVCAHPDAQVQSGIYAYGIDVPPVCMACGDSLESEVTVTQGPDMNVHEMKLEQFLDRDGPNA